MAHLPGLGARAGASIGGAWLFRRMLGMDRRQHVLLAEESIEVLLGLGIEAGIVIRIPRMGRSPVGGGGRAHNRLVEPAHTAGATRQVPNVIAALGIGIAPTDKAG